MDCVTWETGVQPQSDQKRRRASMCAAWRLRALLAARLGGRLTRALFAARLVGGALACTLIAAFALSAASVGGALARAPPGRVVLRSFQPQLCT